MSFLDRFKRKAQDSDAPEGTPDSGSKAAPETLSGGGTPPASKPSPTTASAPVRKPDPAVQAAASGQGAEAPKRAAKKEKPVEPAKSAADEGEMTLELGDFIRRIPQNLLKPGTPDGKTPLKFNLGELADRIARGQTTIPLVEIYKRLPDIFTQEVLPSDQHEIRFPWQKVMKMLAEVATATPGTGLSTQAAESLAEKLKSRRGARNTLPATAPAETEKKLTPEPKPREAKFRSGIEPRVEKGPSPITPILPATPVAPAAAAPSAPAPTSDSGAPTGDDEMLTREELIRSRDTARLAAARVKGEYERQIASLTQERKTLADERDRVITELGKAQREIEDKRDQAEFEKSVAAKSGENLAKLQQERDTLQRELAARDKEREALKAEVAKLPQGGTPAAPDPKLAELMAEREALLQQKTQLSSQLAEFAKPAAAAQIEEAQTSLKREHDAANRKREAEATRALKEAQERFETLNAAKEKLTAELEETRAKASAEAAAHVERVQHELRATTNQRDAEIATALAESQQQAESLKAAHASLQTELAATSKRATEAEQRHSTVTAELAAAHAKVAESSDWQAKTVAQLEADIESYRGRIKTTLQERDALAADKEKLSTQFTGEREGLATRIKTLEEQAAAAALAQQTISGLQAEVEKLKQAHGSTLGQADSLVVEKQKLDAQLSTEREQLNARIRELEAKANTADKAQQTTGALQADVDRLNSELNAARTAAETSALDSRKQIERLNQEHGATKTRAEAVAADFEKFKADHAQTGNAALNAAEAKLDAQTKSLNDLATERDVLAERTKALADQLGKALAAHQTAAGDREGLDALLTNTRAELDDARQQHQKSLELVIAERDKAVAQAGNITEELARTRTEHEGRLKQARTARTELEQNIGAITGERDTLRGQLESTQAAHENTRQQLGSTAASLSADRDRLNGELTSLREQLGKAKADHAATNEGAATAKTEFEKSLNAVQKERDEFSGKASSLAAALDAAQREKEATATNSRAEREASAKAHGELEGRAAALSADRDQLQEKLTTLSAELVGARKEHGEAYTALNEQHSALHAAKDTLAAEFSTTRMRDEKTIADLTGERNSLSSAKNTLEGRLQEATATIGTLSQKVQGLETALANATNSATQHEQHAASLVVQHKDAVDALTGKHQLVLTALTAEKDATIATITAEKAALAATTDDKLAALATQHEKAFSTFGAEKARELSELDERLQRQIAAITVERDQTRAKLATAEEKIAHLTDLLEKSESGSTALAQQMAASAVEADRKLATVTGERDRLLVDKKTLGSELDEAKESHKAQSGVFAREFKAVVKQRDDALAQLEADRKRHEQKAVELAQERAALDKREQEMAARFERDVARLRRERDTIAEQRDSLRHRLEELINQQRRVLDDVAAQATHSARTAEPMPEHAPPPRAREAKVPRREKEANVIDITSAEVVSGVPEQESGLKIPRVRPVVIPPPQVRIL